MCETKLLHESSLLKITVKKYGCLRVCIVIKLPIYNFNSFVCVRSFSVII